MTKRNSVLQQMNPNDDVGRIEGEFVSDPPPKWEPETYNGEGRYVNLPPQEIHRRLDTETDPEERKALKIAALYWMKNNGFADERTQAGEPYRGEKRDAKVVKSLKDCVGKEKVTHVFVGRLS